MPLLVLPERVIHGHPAKQITAQKSHVGSRWTFGSLTGPPTCSVKHTLQGTFRANVMPSLQWMKAWTRSWSTSDLRISSSNWKDLFIKFFHYELNTCSLEILQKDPEKNYSILENLKVSFSRNTTNLCFLNLLIVLYRRSLPYPGTNAYFLYLWFFSIGLWNIGYASKQHRSIQKTIEW